MPDYKLGRLGSEFVVVWYEGGNRKRVRTGTNNPTDAEAFRHRLEQAAQRPKDITVAEILDWRVKQLEGRASASVAAHQAKPLKAILGKLYPMQITPAEQRRYIETRRALGRAPATIRSEVVLLATALQAAVDARQIAERPHIATPPNSEPRGWYLTREQARTLLNACPTYHVRLFIELAIATGGRMTALLELTWDRVDFERGQIDLRKSRFVRMKGRAIAPMTDRIRALLIKAKEIALTDHVIEHGAAPIARINKGVKEAGKRIGMPWLSPHVMRHTSAVWMAEDGNSMEEIAAMLGHKDSTTTQRVYARFSPHYLKKVSRALEF